MYNVLFVWKRIEWENMGTDGGMIPRVKCTKNAINVVRLFGSKTIHPPVMVIVQSMNGGIGAINVGNRLQLKVEGNK